LSASQSLLSRRISGIRSFVLILISSLFACLENNVGTLVACSPAALQQDRPATRSEIEFLKSTLQAQARTLHGKRVEFDCLTLDKSGNECVVSKYYICWSGDSRCVRCGSRNFSYVADASGKFESASNEEMILEEFSSLPWGKVHGRIERDTGTQTAVSCKQTPPPPCTFVPLAIPARMFGYSEYSAFSFSAMASRAEASVRVKITPDVDGEKLFLVDVPGQGKFQFLVGGDPPLVRSIHTDQTRIGDHLQPNSWFEDTPHVIKSANSGCRTITS
jgi:hypothetical protein